MRFLSACILGLLVANPSFAATYTYNYTAEFQSAGTDDTSVFSIADEARALSTITGTMTFSDYIVSGSGSEIYYSPAVVSFNELTIPLDTAQKSVRISRVSSWDELAFLREAPTAVGTNYDSLGFIIRDSLSKTALDAQAFPSALDISLFNINQLYFLNQRDDGDGLFATERTNFTVTQLEIQTSSVPLPAGLPLLVGALSVLGLIKRRKAS